MFSSLPKTSWDTRAWLLGLFLGNFAGLLLLCGGNPTSRRFLESAFPYSAFGYYTGDFVIWLGAMLGALIFPAFLTCLARRLYILWALLPLFLFVLWLVVGEMVAHNLSPLRNPPWAFPLAALMCWAITSFPISLFRLLRQRLRRRASSTSSPAPKRPLLRWAGLFALLAPALALVILGWYNLKHPREVHANIEAHFLGGREARIPLVEKNGGLFVMASLNGQEQLCRIDTGAESVEWPRDLQIEGHLTSRRGESCDVLGACIANQTVVLPRLRVGTYEITNLPTQMSGTGSGLFSPPQRPDADNDVLLGNPAFAMTVLTIDYKNAVMIIRHPEYDFTRQHRRSGDRILQMGWTTDYSDKDWKSSLFGYPAVRVNIAGAPFWCTLDTGWDGPELGLADDFVKHHPSLRQAKHDLAPFRAMYSSAQVERLHDLNITIPCLSPPHVNPISLRVNGLVTRALYGGQGVIGLALMKRYRITIDYERGRVLLEPYAQDGPGHKQEKPQPKAKQAAI